VQETEGDWQQKMCNFSRELEVGCRRLLGKISQFFWGVGNGLRKSASKKCTIAGRLAC